MFDQFRQGHGVSDHDHMLHVPLRLQFPQALVQVNRIIGGLVGYVPHRGCTDIAMPSLLIPMGRLRGVDFVAKIKSPPTVGGQDGHIVNQDHVVLEIDHVGYVPYALGEILVAGCEIVPVIYMLVVAIDVEHCLVALPQVSQCANHLIAVPSHIPGHDAKGTGGFAQPVQVLVPSFDV